MCVIVLIHKAGSRCTLTERILSLQEFAMQEMCSVPFQLLEIRFALDGTERRWDHYQTGVMILAQRGKPMDEAECRLIAAEATGKEEDWLKEMVRGGYMVFDPVIEKYRLTERGEEYEEYFQGKPPSKKFIRKTLEQMVRMGYATFDPATERYALTELGRRLAKELSASEYQDLLEGGPPPGKKH
jgi:hypothetical protein